MDIDSGDNSVTTFIPQQLENEVNSDILVGQMTDEQIADELPVFKPLTQKQLISSQNESSYARISVPPHRYTPLKNHWMELYQPIVEHMKLQIRFNPKKRAIELRVSFK